jgi:hypothetical protein
MIKDVMSEYRNRCVHFKPELLKLCKDFVKDGKVL